MLNIPVLRWGRPYTSLDTDNIIHFSTGETLAKVSQANPGLLAKTFARHNAPATCFAKFPAAISSI